jgi:hypothetical protein
MKADTLKLTLSYVIALGVIGFTCYALVLHPFVVETDVKLWLTGAAGGALAFVFGDQTATRSKIEQQSAFTKGLNATPNPLPEEPPLP